MVKVFDKEQEEAATKKAEADVVRENCIGVLSSIRNGDCMYDFSVALEKVVAAVKEHRKPGQVSIKLSIAPLNKNDDYTILLHDDISINAPKAPKKASIFYASDKNTLQRNDPRQLGFGFK
jgi:hypothetical protein